MSKTQKYLDLKPLKRMVTSGNYTGAVVEIEKRRRNLTRLTASEPKGTDEYHKHSSKLTQLTELAAVCYSRLGNERKAESRFKQALRHHEGPNNMVRPRILRSYAMHCLRYAQNEHAEQMFMQAIRDFNTLNAVTEQISDQRIQAEIWFTQSCYAHLLLNDPSTRKQALGLLIAADGVLQASTKRWYELQNLLVLIRETSRLNPHRAMLIGRAVRLNETSVHNNYVRHELVALSLGHPFYGWYSGFLR